MFGQHLGADPGSRQKLLAEITRHLREAAEASAADNVAAFRDALEHVVQLIIGLDLQEIGTVRPKPRYLELRSRGHITREAKLRALEDHRVLLYEALERAKDRGDREEVRDVAERAIPAIEVEITDLKQQLTPKPPGELTGV